MILKFKLIIKYIFVRSNNQITTIILLNVVLKMNKPEDDSESKYINKNHLIFSCFFFF